MLQAVFGDRPGPIVIGHRGASGYAPENTMVSFERAIALRADAIELDVHPTSDGQLVVIHDALLERTTNGRGPVAAHTLEQIRALDAGSWFDPRFHDERVPTLQEVLEWARGRVRVVVEVKEGLLYYPNIAELLVELLDRTSMRGETLVISFDHPSVQRVKQLAPDVATGVLYYGRPIDAVTLARSAGADALLPHWSLVGPDDVAAAHAAGLLIAPWGGAEQNYARLLELGVDALSADFPDRPRLVLEDQSGAA